MIMWTDAMLQEYVDRSLSGRWDSISVELLEALKLSNQRVLVFVSDYREDPAKYHRMCLCAQDTWKRYVDAPQEYREYVTEDMCGTIVDVIFGDLG